MSITPSNFYTTVSLVSFVKAMDFLLRQFPVNGEEEKKTIALTAEGETGSWLKLIRTISDTAASNVRICLQGKLIRTVERCW